MENTTTNAVLHLQALGFNESEALAYSALTRQGPMTGYQLAKASGVARPNIYGVIDRLEKRGAITKVQLKDGVRYGALPPAEMLARLSSGIDRHLAAAREALGELEGGAGHEYVWNVAGYDAVLERAEAIIGRAGKRLLVGIWAAESGRLSEAIAARQARGVQVVTLCVQGCDAECGGCRGDVYRYPVAGEAASRWLIVVADDRELLMGEVSARGEAQAAHTTLPMIVTIGGQYLRHTIAAAEIVRSAGDRLPEMLDDEAARAIEGSATATGDVSWFRGLLRTVRREHS